jgi:hypothetical protein
MQSIFFTYAAAERYAFYILVIYCLYIIQVLLICHIPTADILAVHSLYTLHTHFLYYNFFCWTAANDYSLLKFTFMARQKGTHKIEGSIGDVTYYKDQDGYKAKAKTELPKNRILTDPNFELTRQNGSEFGRTGKAVKMMRLAFRSLLQNTADTRMTGRLVQRMHIVLRSDTSSARGERTPMKGDLALLQNFEFNVKSQLSTRLFAPYSIVADRATGLLSVSIPSFIPINKIVFPPGATHCRIISSGAAIDFDNGTFDVEDEGQIAELKLDGNATQPITLQSTIAPNSTLPIFMVLGIEFLQELNGTLYTMRNGGFNALTLVKVLI